MHRTLVTTVLMAISLVFSAPALADRDHDHRWKDRDHHYDGRHDHRNHGRHHKHKQHRRDMRIVDRHVTVIRDAPRYRHSFHHEEHHRYHDHRYRDHDYHGNSVPLVSIAGIPVITVRID